MQSSDTRLQNRPLAAEDPILSPNITKLYCFSVALRGLSAPLCFVFFGFSAPSTPRQTAPPPHGEERQSSTFCSHVAPAQPASHAHLPPESAIQLLRTLVMSEK